MVAMREEEEGSGQRLCLVKWRGLEYDKVWATAHDCLPCSACIAAARAIPEAF